MTGLLILAHNNIGDGLIKAATHILGKLPESLETLAVNYEEKPDDLVDILAERIKRLDKGSGVLILTDVYGASHANSACRLLVPGRVELIAGVNLPMLIRALNYRNLPIHELVQRALKGGCEGIFHTQQATTANQAKA